MDIRKRWEAVTEDGNEFLRFERVETRRSNRPDLHAFLLLDETFPASRDIVVSAGHDEIWLDVSDDQIKRLTDDQIRELSRCGVRYDSDNCCLCMFA